MPFQFHRSPFREQDWRSGHQHGTPCHFSSGCLKDWNVAPTADNRVQLINNPLLLTYMPSDLSKHRKSPPSPRD